MSINYTAKSYIALANDLMDAALGNPSFGPIVRQPIPANADQLTLLHWLFAAKGDIPLPAVVLDFQASASGNRLVIPAVAGGNAVQRIWKVYPAEKSLLYPSPYSPVIGGGEVEIGEEDWEITNGRTLIQNDGITSGRWKVVYSHSNSGEVIRRGDGYEAYPVWSRLPRGYVNCAPDTFRWFELTAQRAISQDSRTGKPEQWTRLRNALRHTAIRGMDITDLRDVFLPLKGMEVHEPDGMFFYSEHPSATPPPAGLDQSWTGYNFWHREESTGDIIGVVPASATAAPTRIGRGVVDSWRAADDYQDADQFLYLEMGIRKDASADLPSGSARVFLSSTREYNAAERWQATIPLGDGTLIGMAGDYEMRRYLIARTEFKRVDDASVLPVSTSVVNIGLEFAFTDRFRVRLRKLRMVSGEDAEWVEENLDDARRSAPLPYFPGSMPFALNGDILTGNLIPYNGNPFHGYQLPDLWLDWAAEAASIHAGLTAADLPTADVSGAIIYPIEPDNENETPKPINILLAEQQVLFLRDAQLRYYGDMGFEGPFAHTFVLNTSARENIGSPRPHTWVYTGDDPNTAWAGYQVRPVESLARLVYKTTDRADAADLRLLARTVAYKWLNWLIDWWPDLGGLPFSGPPTDFPGGAEPFTAYDDPHAAAIILRALLWLRMAGDTDAMRADLALRCWQYLESMWVTEGRMAGTWSPAPDELQWYGFWHGEIIETLGLIVKDAKSHLPEGISRDVALDRLAKTYNWLNEWGVREVT